MIQNERQYETTKKKLEELEATARKKQEHARPAQVPEIIWRGHQNGLRALMDDLRAELSEYEKLRAGQSRALPLDSIFEDLPDALVRARIARGWTQKDLARALGTSEQQVQKDEAGGYARASLQRLERVAQALQVRVAGRARLLRRPKVLSQRAVATRRQAPHRLDKTPGKSRK